MSINRRLLEATVEERLDDAKQLLEKGADPHGKVRGEDAHAFGRAAESGLFELVELMLERGADASCSTCSKNWGSPLHLALRRGHGDVARLLLERGADVQARDRVKQETVLHTACDFGYFEIVEELLERGASVDERDEFGVSPLHDAHDVEIAQLLVAKGADVHAVCTEGRTPVFFAARRDEGELFDYFVEQGADLGHLENDGGTLLHAACAGRGSLDLVRRLLDHGLAASAATTTGWTALHYCAVEGFAAAVPLLVSAGANVDALASDGEIGGLTPLLISARYGNVSIAAKLLEAGADACAQDTKGATALSYLLDVEAYRIGLGDLPFSQLLIDHGAVATNKQQRTLARLEKKLQRQRQAVARFDWSKLETFLVELFREGLTDFAGEVDDGPICGFGLDCNVGERGQMMLSLNTLDYLEEQLTQKQRLSAVHEEHVRFGPGNWAYGELAVTTDNSSWHRIVKPLMADGYVDPEIGELLMQSACRAALRLIDEGALAQLPCADEVAVIVIDHDEGIATARARMQRVRAAKA